VFFEILRAGGNIQWQQIHPYSGLFAGVIYVGIRFDFAFFDEGQNACEMK
jgi:hypothetical protein